MSAIVQHKSVTQGIPDGTLSLAFDSNVTKGNLIIAVADSFASVQGVAENADSFELAVAASNGNVGKIYYGVAPSSGAVTVVASFGEGGAVTAHLHVYEVAGYDTLDATGSNTANQVGSPYSVSTSSPTAHANEFVIATFLDASGNDASGTWTGQAGVEGEETTSGGGDLKELFSEGFEVTSTGTITATATSSGTGLVNEALIATFYSKVSGDTYDPTIPFLGTIVVDSSAPAGASDPFLGTMKVLASAPAGLPNPFLGSVRTVGVAPAGVNNPTIGQVVVVASAPNGENNPYLGNVVEA